MCVCSDFEQGEVNITFELSSSEVVVQGQIVLSVSHSIIIIQSDRRQFNQTVQFSQ